MRMFYAVDTDRSRYWVAPRYRWKDEWTDDIQKMKLFKTRGAAVLSLYRFNISPYRYKMGAKIELPEWLQIVPIEVQLFAKSPV